MKDQSLLIEFKCHILNYNALIKSPTNPPKITIWTLTHNFSNSFMAEWPFIYSGYVYVYFNFTSKIKGSDDAKKVGSYLEISELSDIMIPTGFHHVSYPC
jgi:hypothetical protein